MALVPIRIDRTSKPPLGTPLRSDGHWSVQGLVGAWAFNEGAGGVAYDLRYGNNLFANSPLNQDGFVIPDTSSANTLRCGRSPVLEPQNCLSIVLGVTKLGTPTNFGKLIHYGQNETAPYGLYGIEQYGSYDGYLSFRAGLLDLNFAADTSSSVLETGKTYGVAMVLGTDIRGYVNGLHVATSSTNGAPLSDQKTNSGLSIGQNNENTANAYPAKYHYVFIYNVALTPPQVASLSANPWQIYEPELLWIEVPDGAGGTTYSDTLTALAESYAGVTDVATYVDAATALITAGVEASSAITMTEAVLSTAQAADTVSDAMQRTESVLSVVQAADTVADAQAMAESLLTEITANITVSDSLNNSSTESLSTEINAASTVQDVVSILEQVYTTLEAQASVTEQVVSGVAESLLTSATAITSATDLQLMVDNVTVMALGGASLGEIGSYLEQVTAAATGQGSVTDVLVGVFVGRYIFAEVARARLFAEIAQARTYSEIARTHR